MKQNEKAHWRFLKQWINWRLRKLADGYRAKLSGADSDSCDAFRERLAGCTKLLQESAELCEEGARLSGEVAAKKDALTSIIKERRESP